MDGHGFSPWQQSPERTVDAAITGAPTQIALQRVGQIRPSFTIERGRGHDHARGAKTALESLRPEKRLLHGMQIAIGREALNGRHVAVHRTESRSGANGDAPVDLV